MLIKAKQACIMPQLISSYLSKHKTKLDISQYKDAFAKKYDVNLGFMSFFTKAVTEALYIFPAVNGQIDNTDMIFM